MGLIVKGGQTLVVPGGSVSGHTLSREKLHQRPVALGSVPVANLCSNAMQTGVASTDPSGVDLFNRKQVPI